MANVIRMGSLYLDGRPILPWVEFHGDETIGIRKAVPGKEIPWVLVNGILIADRCLLSNISWDDLNAQSLIFGKEVSVGGLRYTLRSLRVGASEDMPNEWDAALDIVGENGGVWTGKGPRFWGQERAAGIPLYRVLRAASRLVFERRSMPRSGTSPLGFDLSWSHYPRFVWTSCRWGSAWQSGAARRSCVAGRRRSPTTKWCSLAGVKNCTMTLASAVRLGMGVLLLIGGPSSASRSADGQSALGLAAGFANGTWWRRGTLTDPK